MRVLKLGDGIRIEIKGVGYTGIVQINDGYYFRANGGANSKIIKELLRHKGLPNSDKDIHEYAAKYVSLVARAKSGFPECKTLKDLTELIHVIKEDAAKLDSGGSKDYLPKYSEVTKYDTYTIYKRNRYVEVSSIYPEVLANRGGYTSKETMFSLILGESPTLGYWPEIKHCSNIEEKKDILVEGYLKILKRESEKDTIKEPSYDVDTSEKQRTISKYRVYKNISFVAVEGLEIGHIATEYGADKYTMFKEITGINTNKGHWPSLMGLKLSKREIDISLHKVFLKYCQLVQQIVDRKARTTPKTHDPIPDEDIRTYSKIYQRLYKIGSKIILDFGEDNKVQYNISSDRLYHMHGVTPSKIKNDIYKRDVSNYITPGVTFEGASFSVLGDGGVTMDNLINQLMRIAADYKISNTRYKSYVQGADPYKATYATTKPSKQKSDIESAFDAELAGL